MLYALCFMLMLVVATRRDHEQPAFKRQKVVKKLHRMWNWDDIKKRLVACVRMSRGDEGTAQIKNKMDVNFVLTYLKKTPQA